MEGGGGGGGGVGCQYSITRVYCALVQHEVPFLKKSVRSKNSGR